MFSRVFCVFPFGCREASGSPCSQPDGRASPLMRTFQCRSQGVVKLSSECLFGFGCSAGTIGTDMAGVVVAVGENCDLMYGSEVWSIVQGAYAQYALATCSLTTLKPFSLSFGKVGTISIVGGTSLQCLQEAGAPGPRNPRSSGRLASLARVSLESNKVLGAGTVNTAETGDGIDFVNGLGADVVVDYHEQKIRYSGQ